MRGSKSTSDNHGKLFNHVKQPIDHKDLKDHELPQFVTNLETKEGAPEAKGSLSKRGQSVAKVKLKWRQSVDVSTLYLYFTLSRT